MPVSPNTFAVLIAAGGKSVRFGANKLLQKLAGQAVIARAVGAYLVRNDVAQIVIATSDRPAIESALNSSSGLDPRITFCEGGLCRAASVRNALETVDPMIEWVAVHDAARPIVPTEVIDRTWSAARTHGAAAAALPVHLTIKEARGALPAKVERTIPRANLWAMQTPQIMKREDLERAYAICPIPLDEVTDDVQLIELAGSEVWLVEGDERNIKITTAMDLRIAELLIKDGI